MVKVRYLGARQPGLHWMALRQGALTLDPMDLILICHRLRFAIPGSGRHENFCSCLPKYTSIR